MTDSAIVVLGQVVFHVEKKIGIINGIGLSCFVFGNLLHSNRKQTYTLTGVTGGRFKNAYSSTFLGIKKPERH